MSSLYFSFFALDCVLMQRVIQLFSPPSVTFSYVQLLCTRLIPSVILAIMHGTNQRSPKSCSPPVFLKSRDYNWRPHATKVQYIQHCPLCILFWRITGDDAILLIITCIVMSFSPIWEKKAKLLAFFSTLIRWYYG